MKKDPIEEALGLRSMHEIDAEETVEIDQQLPVLKEETSTEISTINMSDADILSADENLKDIEKARQNIEQIVELGRESLNEMIELAKQSESPRAFEVASGLMKTLLDANRDFVDMSTRKKYAKEEILNPKKEEEAAQTNVTNNNLILSTADLLKMIKGET
jgi:hypothetical protein